MLHITKALGRQKSFKEFMSLPQTKPLIFRIYQVHDVELQRQGIRISEFQAKTEFIQNSDFFDPFDSGNIVCSSFLKRLQMKNQFF